VAPGWHHLPMAVRSCSGGPTRVAVLMALVGLVITALKGRVRRYAVAEASMWPALRPDDYLIAVASNKIVRGAVIVYPDPADPSRELIKRAIGLEGETVTISGGRVAIDGAVLDEPWAGGPTYPDGEWQIQPGTIFTLGDNRHMSSGDGRASGPIKRPGVYRVSWRYWPLADLGRV